MTLACSCHALSVNFKDDSVSKNTSFLEGGGLLVKLYGQSNLPKLQRIIAAMMQSSVPHQRAKTKTQKKSVHAPEKPTLTPQARTDR